MNELLKKYESIDQSKLNEGAIKILNRVKTITSEFTTDDAKNNKIAEDVLNEIIKKYPDSVKIVKQTPKAKPAPKKVAKTKKTVTKSTAKKSGNNIMSVAKEIQKSEESWKDAMERAKKVLKERKEEKEEVVQKQKTELEKLYALVKTRKELKGFTKSDIQRDAVRTAKPSGARFVTKQGTTSNGYGTFDNKIGRKYWETRDRHADRLAPNYPKDTPLLANGGAVTDAPFSVEIFKTKLRLDNELTSSSKGDFPTFAKAKEFAIDMIDNGNYYAYIISKNGYLWGVSSNGVESFANGGGIDGGMSNLTIQNISFAEGGEVEGSKIWDLLSKEQKGNFITKYKPEIEKNLKLTRDIIFNSTKNDNWNILDKNIKNVFNKHIENKKFYFENIGKKVTWEDYKGDKRKGEIDGIDFNGDYIIIEPDELYGGDTLSPDEVTIKDSSKKKYLLFADGGSIIGDTVSAIFNPNEKDGKIKTTFGDKTKTGFFEMMTSVNNTPEEITSAIFIPNEKTGRVYTEFGAKTKTGLYEMINNMRNTFELGGAFMMTDLAGHTGGSDGLGNSMPLSGTSGTYYTGLVGETGAMSSGELFMDGGAMAQNQQVINDASQSYVNYYLGEGASQGIYKDGGAIKNQYEGRTPEDIWNSLTQPQRGHFLFDHISEIEAYKQIEKLPNSELVEAYKSEWLSLDEDIKNRFSNHVREGQYAYGGKTKSRPSMRELYIEQIASLTNTRTVGVDAFAKEHNLTDSELSNLMSGIGRKIITQSDFVTALVGNKNNPKQKEVIAFAKSDKAYKMAKGGEIEIKSIKVGDFLQKKDNKAKAKVINVKGDGKYSTEIFIEDLYGNKVSRPLDFTRIDEWKIINEPTREINRIKKVLSEQYAEGGFMNNIYAKGGGVSGKLDSGVYRVGKPIKVSPILYAQKIVEIFDNGDISTATDYGRKLSDFKSQKYPIITKEQLEAEYKMADGGFMNNVYAKGGEVADIQKMKKALIAKAKSKGIYENFGQKEVRDLEDKYGYTNSVREFDNWAMNFDLSQMADGGSLMDVHDGTGFMENPVYAERGSYLEDNDGFMRADNEFNYRYPTKDVFIETFDEPIDLTDDSSVKIKQVTVESINDDIDLTEDGKLKVRMGYEPKNRTPEKFGDINPRAFEFIPTTISKKHKND